MKKTTLVASLALAGLAGAFAPASALTVPRFGTAEIVLYSTNHYDGAAATTANPFDLVTTAKVVDPAGRTYTAEAFFDGNGIGGAQGNTWKLRIYADYPGTWRWTTTSAVPGLGGRSGSFTCSGTLAGVFGAGPVVENPANRRTLMYQYGKPVFLTAKFLDAAAPSESLKWSHTLLSEKYSDTTRSALLSRHRAMGLNKMDVYLANRGDYNVPTTPWKGTASANDKKRFDLARWRTYDRWVQKLRDSGMVAQLWFFADDSGFGNLPDVDRQRLERYAMARLSGYVNTMFTVALEWQEGWSSSEVTSHANYLHQRNPWARLVSVHGTPGDFSFPTASWADYMSIQAGNSASHPTVNASTIRNRNRAAKPVLQEEHGLGQENTAGRQNAWAAFTGGAAGVGTGAHLAQLVAFTRAVPFEKMQPMPSLRLAGTAYVLAAPGSAYVAYLPAGGSVKLDLSKITGPLKVRWYNPATGAWSSSLGISGGAARVLVPPGGGDWAVYVSR